MLDRLNVFALELSTRMKREEGQGAAEYALVLAFVAVAVIAALTLLGNNIAAELRNVAGQV
jgi:Flp pilus assembly pilin Flp